MIKATARALLAVAALGVSGVAIAGDEGDARVIKRHYSFEWKAPFADMSPQGMAIISEAMKRERIPANAREVARARQRVLDLLTQPRLDLDAIRKAQAEERKLAIQEHAVAQDRMLRAYRQLSLEDRRAFAEGMREQETRMLQHMERARERMRQMEERMQRDVERVKKETGRLWIIIPPVPPATAADGRG